MRLIDADSLDITTITTDDYSGNEILDVVMKEDIDDVPTVEAIPKEQYEDRLKADLEAMLTEIQLEIEELDTPNNSDAYMTCSEIIQQKIDKLKGKEDRKWIIK